jgi:hypothetical protein
MEFEGQRMSRNSIAREFNTTASRLIYGETVGILAVWGTVEAGTYRLMVRLWMTALRTMTTQQVRRALDGRKEDQDCALHLIIRPEPATT